MSCLLALLLPLKELQGEIRGIAETDILDTQLRTGNVDVPSISTALKESVAVEFDLEEGETNRIEESNGDETTTNEEMGIKLSLLTLAQISLHELPQETHVPSMSSAVQKSGTVTIDIEEDETNPTDGTNEVKSTSKLPPMSSAVQKSGTVTSDINEDETNPSDGTNEVKTTSKLSPMSSAVQRSGTVTIDIEEDETNPTEERNDVKTTSNMPPMSSAEKKSETVTIDIEEDETNPTERGKEVKMPSSLPPMSSAVQDSVVVTIDLEEDEINPAEGRNGDETTTNDYMGIELSLLTPTEISLYELPRETHDTPL